MRLRILVANDDGLDSAALQCLVAALAPVHDVLVSVPARQASGTGHGFTFTRPIVVTETVLHGAKVLVVDGFPSDAVKYAVCTEPRPDIILAGINPGENAGVCAPYSGTVACAREGALWGIPSFALSSHGMTSAHYEAIASWALALLGNLPPCPPGIFWNINFPGQAPSTWGAAKVCAASQALLDERDRGRALPDVRDGLKPVHRRVLYAMHEARNYLDKPYKKSARIVGDVIGKYHPHGDSRRCTTRSCAWRRTSRCATMLVDGQGNFGSVDGDPAAAMRYTEVRMTPFAEEMLKDDHRQGDRRWGRPNYDGSEKEPTVLPSASRTC
jgi:5'/3'-nucleotidase SurE